MEISVNVSLNAPGLIAALEKLAEALTANTAPVSVAFKESTRVKSEPATASTDTTPESVPDPTAETPTVTLEQVRARLAALAQAGKQAEVKKLLEGCGVKKLTDVPAEKYAELLAQAEGL